MTLFHFIPVFVSGAFFSSDDIYCPYVSAELVDGTEENAYYVGLSLKYHEFLYVPQEASDLLIVAKFDSSEVAAKVCQILDRKKDNEKKK